jgi:ADP-ribose pyrophosphatase
LRNLSKSTHGVNVDGISYNFYSMKLTARYTEHFQRTLHRYQGHSVGFRSDQVRLPNGRRRPREYLTHPGAVGVLAFDSLGKIILVKQYRYPVGTFTYEIPAGKLSPREAPLACVKRELEEETGFRAQHITKMLSYWPTAAFSNELIHLYVARGLKASRQKPDEDEFLEIVKLSPKQLEQMIRRGRIRDSKTLIAYLAWKSLA